MLINLFRKLFLASLFNKFNTIVIQIFTLNLKLKYQKKYLGKHH